MSLSVKTQGGGGGFFASILVNGLKETDTVYATKQEPDTTKLPAGYTLLEYIESSGTQFVDTQHAVQSENLRIVFDFEYTEDHSKSSLFGSQGAGGVAGGVSINPHNDNFYVGSSVNAPVVSFSAYLHTRYLLDCHAVNGEFSASMNGKTETGYYDGVLVKELPLYLLANNIRGTASELLIAKLYACRIYDSGNLVRDYVPCINPAGEIGLYDLVSSAFFPNAGTGVFIAGPAVYVDGNKTKPGKWGPIPNPKVVVPDGYTQLEHIESTGEQYIDTRFKPNQNSAVVMDAELVGTGGTYPAVFGSHDSGKSFYVHSHTETTWNGLVVSTTKTLTCAKEGRHTIMLNAEAALFQIDGVSTALSVSAFQSGVNLHLFAIGNSTGVENQASAKLYSCQVYDNNTLSRDYVPCINPAGQVGLYDLVSAAFFPNAGTGVFIAGPEIPATVEGYIIPRINELGMWKVTATDGEKTCEKYVLVDVAAQISVDMSFLLWLYHAGDECEEVTGGWSSPGWTTHNLSITTQATKNEDHMYLKTPGDGKFCFAGTQMAVDASMYKTLHMEISTSTVSAALEFAITTRKHFSPDDVFFHQYDSLDRGVISVDISAVNSLIYVCFASGGQNASRGGRVYNVWLEV